MTLQNKYGALQTRDVKKLADQEILRLLEAASGSGGPKFDPEELAELNAEVAIRRRPALDERLKQGRSQGVASRPLSAAEKQAVRESFLNPVLDPTEATPEPENPEVTKDKTAGKNKR